MAIKMMTGIVIPDLDSYLKDNEVLNFYPKADGDWDFPGMPTINPCGMKPDFISDDYLKFVDQMKEDILNRGYMNADGSPSKDNIFNSFVSPELLSVLDKLNSVKEKSVEDFPVVSGFSIENPLVVSESFSVLADALALEDDSDKAWFGLDRDEEGTLGTFVSFTPVKQVPGVYLMETYISAFSGDSHDSVEMSCDIDCAESVADSMFVVLDGVKFANRINEKKYLEVECEASVEVDMNETFKKKEVDGVKRTTYDYTYRTHSDRIWSVQSLKVISSDDKPYETFQSSYRFSSYEQALQQIQSCFDEDMKRYGKFLSPEDREKTVRDFTARMERDVMNPAVAPNKLPSYHMEGTSRDAMGNKKHFDITCDMSMKRVLVKELDPGSSEEDLSVEVVFEPKKDKKKKQRMEL